MKAVIVILTFLASSFCSANDSKPLYLAGVVPYRGDVKVSVDSSGKFHAQQMAPDKLQIHVQKRGPASVITASAP